MTTANQTTMMVNSLAAAPAMDRTFVPGASREHQQWVWDRLPLTAEQYKDLVCGLRNEQTQTVATAMMDDDDDNTIIDLTAPESAKKRKR